MQPKYNIFYKEVRTQTRGLIGIFVSLVSAVMSCDWEWEGNRRSGVALAMRHSRTSAVHPPTGSRSKKKDEHQPTVTWRHHKFPKATEQDPNVGYSRRIAAAGGTSVELGDVKVGRCQKRFQIYFRLSDTHARR